ncbi:MAG: ABC transporter substrate-binding protein [Deltaproteobacteria bacterium]|jgi:putative ABC transport system substrate-binding protein|nr:ABC transporter substrate-binding protein [Deltaproteobacteria bacterium]
MKLRLAHLLFSCLIFIAGPALAAKVVIFQQNSNLYINQAASGFKDSLSKAGLEASYKNYNAQNDRSEAAEIVRQIIADQPDLILAVGTIAAQTTAAKIKDVPILFTAVTDPVFAGVTQSWDKPEGNVTGTSDLSPLADQAALIKEIQPDITTVGVIYNSSEINSVVQVKEFKNISLGLGLKVVEAITPNKGGVYQTAQTLIKKVQAVFVPTDNTVISAYESILKFALTQKTPLYTAEANPLRKGGVASISLNYYELGLKTGEMAIKILTNQAKPADLPVEKEDKFSLVLNAKYSNLIGLKIPEKVFERAQEIIQ